MRKHIRQVLRNKAYKNGGGIEMFKALWKDYKKKNHIVKNNTRKPKKRNALSRIMRKVFRKKSK